MLYKGDEKNKYAEFMEFLRLEGCRVLFKKELVLKAFKQEPDSEFINKDVIIARYFEDLTYKQIGEKIGKGTERARQITSKSLRCLRHPLYRVRFVKIMQRLAYGDWEM